MSTTIMSICWPLQGMTPAQKAVLISLSDNANDEGVCWPSIKTIAKRTCLSERGVQLAIRWLVEAELLKKHERYGRSTVFTITPALYTPRTECTPALSAPPPPHSVHPTPALCSPRTVKEPSIEPSTNTGRETRPSGCPVQKIVDLYNELLTPELPEVVLMNKDRQAKVRSRWNESPVHQCIEFWADYFTTVKASAFLMGRAEGKNGSKPFRATFDWLIAPSNFVKVVEGNYHA